MALVKPDKAEECLSIGSDYEFTIVSREDENGQLMLSRRRILFAQAWEKVTQLYADDAVVEGEVAAVNRGGAMMVVEGLRAFLPGSHFLAGQTPTEGFIGQKLQVSRGGGLTRSGEGATARRNGGATPLPTKRPTPHALLPAFALRSNSSTLTRRPRGWSCRTARPSSTRRSTI